MTDAIPLTEIEFRKFAPNAKRQYVETLLANLDVIDAAGIRKNNLRLCHFMAQCHAETGGFTILRESLDYRTVSAVRKAWKARASKYSDAWIAENLLRNPVALGDWAYGGRMGNRKGTSDGFDYRGGGWIQTTGKDAVQCYCKLCGLELRPDILDDYEATLRFAAAEWTAANCNKWADQNNILALSRAINVGNANSGIVPNGMSNRRAAFAKAWSIWGTPQPVESPAPVKDTEPAPLPPPTATAKDLRSVSRKFFLFAWIKRLAAFLGIGTGGTLTLTDITQKSKGLSDVVSSLVADPVLLAVVVASVAVIAVVGALEAFGIIDYSEGRWTPSGAQ